MATAPPVTPYRDRAFSLWQSAIHATLLRHAAQGRITLAPGRRGLGATAGHPIMMAAERAMRTLQPAPRFSATDLGDCAKLYTQIAWDEIFDPDKVAALKNQLADSTCDPLWGECLAEYELYLTSGQQQPYTGYTDINQYVLANCFPDQAQIAIIGDWGTGMEDALALLRQIADNFHPDVLIHLGDIYYSGLPGEDADNFTAPIAATWPENAPLVFTLDGNHDRYAGAGGGYYPLIARLNPAAQRPQPNSYFALRNNFWQLVAMDTGYHDTDPYTVTTNVTYLEPNEAAWHLDKIENNGLGVDRAINPGGVRGTVLLSHHPLMSAAGVGQNQAGAPLAVNPNLAGALAPVFHLIDFWLWGHEHDLCIFEPYSMGAGQPLPAGRCVGASAIPVFTPQAAAPDDLVIPASESGPPRIIAGTGLGSNGVVFNHAYAMLTLDGAALTLDYYQIDSTDAAADHPPALTRVYSEAVLAPRAAPG